VLTSPILAGYLAGVNDKVTSFSAMTAHIGFLIFDDFQLLDAAGPIAAFEIAERNRPGAYRVTILAKRAGAIASSSGATMGAVDFRDAGPFDTLVVAGGDGTRRAYRDEDLLAFLRERAKTTRRVASVCSGAFLLAAAGLLDGRRATTHWSRTVDFGAKFPKVRLDPDRIFIRDENVWTSAGITAGIDLSLALIADDLGEEVARAVARQLVVYRRRPGGQSQFSALIEIERPEGRFGALIGWARERLGEDLCVERLADRAGMSPRNFARRFQEETGVTPARAMERLRVEAARERVEAGEDPIEGVAETFGFGDPERMRRAFLRAFGQPPQALRRHAKAG
jgi:transcriptional regulator GlxA family with amidase domain